METNEKTAILNLNISSMQNKNYIPDFGNKKYSIDKTGEVIRSINFLAGCNIIKNQKTAKSIAEKNLISFLETEDKEINIIDDVITNVDVNFTKHGPQLKNIKSELVETNRNLESKKHSNARLQVRNEVTCAMEKEPIELTQEQETDNLINFNEETNDNETARDVDFNKDIILDEAINYFNLSHQKCAEDSTITLNTETQSFCLNKYNFSLQTANNSEQETEVSVKLTGDTSTQKVFVRRCGECKASIKEDVHVLSWETMDFCNESCLLRYQNVIEIFKKRLGLCSYCQNTTVVFLTFVGERQNTKFCSEQCLQKYNQFYKKSSNESISLLPTQMSLCAACNRKKQVKILFDQENKNGRMKKKFCSLSCFFTFKLANKIEPFQCDICRLYFDYENSIEFFLYFDDTVQNLCSKACQNIYIIANRRIIPCAWCKVKKYNFDMIRKICSNGLTLMICSLNCLKLWNANFVNTLQCANCTKKISSHYHLTMSDSPVRKFCSYPCALSYRNKFLNNLSTVNRKAVSSSYSSQNTLNVNQRNLPQTCTSSKPQINHQVAVKPPLLPFVKNADTTCESIVYSKKVSCYPRVCTKETQTNEIREKTVLVPVPIFLPTSLYMFNDYGPIPLQFQLHTPDLLFIPKTCNSENEVMEKIEKIPKNELIMTVDNTNVENDKEDTDANRSSTSEAVDTKITFKNGVQMKMTTEMNQDNVIYAGTGIIDEPQPTEQLVKLEKLLRHGQRKRINHQLPNKNNSVKKSRGECTNLHVEK